VLTPRRTLLLLGGFIAFFAAYMVYAQILGWIDGLPQLPANMLNRSEGPGFQPPNPGESPTQLRLAAAFGAKAPETDYAYYPNQFTFINGESLLVLASGPVPSEPKSTRVPLAPFSLAIFGKQKPPHLRQPGEIAEITTIHADKGILEFDQVINTPNDMRTAKLLRVELISDFEKAFEDPRRGMVHIRNNQRSADENQALTIRTVGPVFYRDSKAVAGTPSAQGPDFWTDAPVEIVDRQNLPRGVGANAPNTVAAKTEDARVPGAVEEMVAGRRLPPPTLTAIGMRIYLEPAGPPDRAKPKKAGSGLQGLRRIEFLEQVVVSLWVDNGQSMVGSDGPAEPPAPSAPGAPEPQSQNVLALTPPPAALSAITGELGTAAYTARLLNRALLQIETRGPFYYDAEKSLARFDVVPHSDPNLPNDVQTTKVPAQGGLSTLNSQVLELELNGGATTANRPANAPPINRVHAWTYSPGRFLTVTAQDEATEAYGKDLVHDRAAQRTELNGAPLYVVRERNVLSAGSPQHGATLISKPGPGDGPDRKPEMTVRGAGRIDLYDNASNTTGPSALWRTSMVQTRETVNGRTQDLYTFTDDARFEDVKADYWLKGNVLKLWLEPRDDPKSAGGKPAAPAQEKQPGQSGQPKPSRIQAIGTVTGHSAEYDIDECTLLNAFFADIKPAPVAVAVAPAPQPANPMGAPPAPAPVPAPAPAPGAALPAPAPVAVAEAPVEAEKPKPPYKIRAKLIDTWVNRVPAPPTTLKPGDRPGAKAEVGKAEPGKAGQEGNNGVKYQLDRARCEENVTVHQDPTEPNKARGVDILGRLLLIYGYPPDGNIMIVYGWPNRPGEVHQEDTSLIGPEVKLDQVHNTAFVKGRGALTMPTNNDLSGSELTQPEVLVIHWRDEMDFRGAARSAKFEGKVSARQGDSWVVCNTMHVTFDRPIYFNQTQKKDAPPPKAKDPKNAKDPKKGNDRNAPGQKGAADDDDKARIETVFCYPAAADSAEDKTELYVTYQQVELEQATGKMIKWQRLTAQELRMFAQAQDPGGGEKYQKVEADGPGVLRIWQMGDKNPTGSGPNDANNKPGQPGQPGGGKQPGPGPRPAPPMGPGQQKQPGAPGQGGAKPANNDDDQEMKLTLVTFSGRMTGIDKNKVYQQATFRDNIHVVNVPSDSPTIEIERHKLPPRAQILTCTKELVVWTHKKPDAPTVQHMDAYGNAYMRSDEYDGWGEIITQDGQVVILTGSDVIPARVMNRFNRANDQAGKKIIHDRATGSIKVIESYGGTLGGSK
jgi:hypothetical protein